LTAILYNWLSCQKLQAAVQFPENCSAAARKSTLKSITAILHEAERRNLFMDIYL
jgi:hypothetical protein